MFWVVARQLLRYFGWLIGCSGWLLWSYEVFWLVARVLLGCSKVFGWLL